MDGDGDRASRTKDGGDGADSFGRLEADIERRRARSHEEAERVGCDGLQRHEQRHLWQWPSKPGHVVDDRRKEYRKQ